jgi:hypothetical protein
MRRGSNRLRPKHKSTRTSRAPAKCQPQVALPRPMVLQCTAHIILHTTRQLMSNQPTLHKRTISRVVTTTSTYTTNSTYLRNLSTHTILDPTTIMMRLSRCSISRATIRSTISSMPMEISTRQMPTQPIRSMSMADQRGMSKSLDDALACVLTSQVKQATE